MQYTVSNIQTEVRKLLEMNDASEPLIEDGDIDALSLDEVIESKICEAVRFIEERAPIYLLDGGDAISTGIYWPEGEGKGMGSLILPDDFMRLISFKMTDWERPAEIIYENDDRYKLQQSKWGLKGNPERPVAAIVQYPVGLTLEFYTCEGGEGTAVERAHYLRLPEIDEDSMVDICEKLYNAVIYYIGYLTCMTYSNFNQASAFIQQAMAMAQIATTPTQTTQEEKTNE